MKRKGTAGAYKGYGPGTRRQPQFKRYKPYIAPKAAAHPGEMKYFDCEATSLTIPACTTSWVAGARLDPARTVDIGDPTIATPLCLFAPKKTAALNGRIGRKVTVFSVKYRGQILVPPQAAVGTADASAVIRFLLLVDKQTNAAQYTASDVLQSTVGTTVINAFQAPNGFGRFMVLKDRVFGIGNLNMAGNPTTPDVVQGGQVINFKFTRKFPKGLVVNFNSTNGGTVADIIDNSFHILCGTSSIAYAPILSYYTRVGYKE